MPDVSAVPESRSPATARELTLMHDLARRLISLHLTVKIDQTRRQVTAMQTAIAGLPGTAGAQRVALTQSVRLARSRHNPGALAWMLLIEDGFRGQGGATFEKVADGDDLDQAARVLGKILAVVDAPAPAGRPAAP